MIRAKRRELDLTQDEVAARIKISTPYIGHLESGKRHPSDKIVTKLADVLGLDNRELFFLANPHAQALISEPVGAEGSSWEQFQKNEKLQRILLKHRLEHHRAADFGREHARRTHSVLLQQR